MATPHHAYDLHTTPQGVRVVTIPRLDTETVTITVLCHFGSRYETAAVSGIAHFTEHMLFKGSAKRPKASMISRALDRVGANFNAYTSKDHTAYYIKIRKDYLPLAVDILADMFIHPLFADKEIAREKGVILEEIKMYHENPLFHIETVAEQVTFHGHQLGRDIAGSPATVTAMTSADFRAIHRRYYHPRHVVLSLAGNIPANTKDLINQHFVFPATGRSATVTNTPPHMPKKWRVLVDQRPLKQSQLSFGLPAVGAQHPDRPALSVLSVILGGNMSSRLFQEVREKRGLAYTIQSSLELWPDCGYVNIHAGVEKQRLPEAVRAIWQQVVKMRTMVSATDVRHAQEFIAGQMALSLESSSTLAQWYGLQILNDQKVITPSERLQQIKKVTPQDVKRVAKKYLTKSHINLAVIGDHESRAVEKLVGSLAA